MKKNKSFLIVFTIILAIIVIGTISTVYAHPTPVPPPWYTFPPAPIPLPAPTPNDWRNTGEEGSSGINTSSGGLDSHNNKTVAGNDDQDPAIRLWDGISWEEHSVTFQPTGLEWSNAESDVLYASDNTANEIWVSSDPELATRSWFLMGGAGTAPGEFINPNGMWSHPSGILYVVDTGNSRIQFYDGNTWNIIDAPQDAQYMIDICIYNEVMYVTDYLAHCIWYRGLNEIAWSSIADTTYLWYPSYFDVNEQGDLFIESWVYSIDGFLKNIIKYSSGIFSTYVTTGRDPGFITNNGTAEEIAINEHNSLFYRDPFPGIIYKESCDINKVHTFNLNKTEYPVVGSQTDIYHTVDNTMDVLTLLAFPECHYSTVMGEGFYALDFGENLFPISCVSESGILTEYTIHVTRELSDNALLSDISLNSITIDGFIPDLFEYMDITYSYDHLSRILNATTQNVNATILGTGTIQLDVGENIFTLTVIAQDTVTIQNYVLNITREEEETSPSPSPTPTSAPTPVPSSTPTPTPVPSSTSTPSPSSSPSPTQTAPPSPSPTETDEPKDTPTPSTTQDATTSPTQLPVPSVNPSVQPSPAMTISPESLEALEEEIERQKDIIKLLRGSLLILGGGLGAVGGTIIIKNTLRKKRWQKKNKKP